MPPKAPQNCRNRQCPLCHTWVTTAGFGRHVQHCKKWDQQDEGESAHGQADHKTSNDKSMLIDHFSISTISELDTSDSGGAPDPPDANFDLEWEAEAPLVDREDEEELEYQKHQVYNDDDDWWNEYCIPQLEPTIEEEDEDNEEFEELLHWMDNELDKEIGENYDLLLTAEDKQNIKMFAIKNRHNITNLLYSNLRNLFYNELHILTAFTLQKCVMKLAGWKPERLDMCINSLDCSSEWARTVFTAEDVDEDAIDA